MAHFVVPHTIRLFPMQCYSDLPQISLLDNYCVIEHLKRNLKWHSYLLCTKRTCPALPCIVHVCACAQCLHDVFGVCWLWYRRSSTRDWPTKEEACRGRGRGGARRIRYCMLAYKYLIAKSACVYVCVCVSMCVRVMTIKWKCNSGPVQYPHTHQCQTFSGKAPFLTLVAPTSHSHAS